MITEHHRVYVITNRTNNKVYVGVTSAKRLVYRFWSHRNAAKIGRKGYLYDSMRKYGTDNFIIEELADCHSRIEALRLERYWIGLLNSKDNKYGYNLTWGGDGLFPVRDKNVTAKQIANLNRKGIKNPYWLPKGRVLGYKISDETKEKMREAALRRSNNYVTDSTREKLSLAAKGRTSYMSGKKHTEEAKQKMRAFRLGKKPSEETRKKMSEAQHRRYSNVPTE